MSDVSKFELPSDPEKIISIRNSLIQISAQQVMIADRQAAIKDIKDALKDEFKMPPALITRLVKATDDSAYVEMTAENSVFEFVRESVLGDAGLPDDNA